MAGGGGGVNHEAVLRRSSSEVLKRGAVTCSTVKATKYDWYKKWMMMMMINWFITIINCFVLFFLLQKMNCLDVYNEGLILKQPFLFFFCLLGNVHYFVVIYKQLSLLFSHRIKRWHQTDIQHVLLKNALNFLPR